MISLLMMSFKLNPNAVSELEKKWKVSYTFTMSVGHSSPACGGVGDRCVNFSDFSTYSCHITCWGIGTDCSHTVTIELGFRPSLNAQGSVTMDLINEQDIPSLNMPGRSFLIESDEGNDAYLNIPPQVVIVNNFNSNDNVIYALSHCTVTNTPTY